MYSPNISMFHGPTSFATFPDVSSIASYWAMADWLEERGDPSAESWRVSERPSELPIFGGFGYGDGDGSGYGYGYGFGSGYGYGYGDGCGCGFGYSDGCGDGW